MNKEMLLTEQVTETIRAHIKALSLSPLPTKAQYIGVLSVKKLARIILKEAEPLVRADERMRIGEYLNHKKSHGHLNSTVIEALIERLCKGEMLSE